MPSCGPAHSTCKCASPATSAVASPGHGMHAGHVRRQRRRGRRRPDLRGRRAGGRAHRGAPCVPAGRPRGCNTNLGIVLLCAPLLAAFERCGRRARCRRACAARCAAVLQALDVADARAAYRAIALARPAGLGHVGRAGRAGRADGRPARGDGAGRAIATASPGSTGTSIRTCSSLGLPAFLAARAAGGAVPARAMQPPSWSSPPPCPIHTLCESTASRWRSLSCARRRHGVRARRGGVLDARPAFAAWDEDLKARGLNPGHQRRPARRGVPPLAALEPSAHRRRSRGPACPAAPARH